MNKDGDSVNFNTDELDEVIVGRVKPHIYAFSTNTIPNHLKVGDTYRPVKVRLDEWRQKYANLSPELDEEAMMSDDVFFRDYAVHNYLEKNLGRKRLTKGDAPKGEYFSNEFFKETSTNDVESAISDIKDDFKNNTQKYQYYNFEDRPTPIETEYKSTGMWTPRPNQDEVIKNFKKALENGRTKLLLYAVMRFGKTFTAMCCANEMDAKIVLVVSAKADVKEEWRMTVQSADNFDDYVFMDSNKLKSDEKIIKNTLDDNKKVVIFLTLQDLKDKQIKDKHKEVFSNKIDLLLVDETHFGARAEVYGRVLRDQKERTDDFIDFKEAGEEIKVLHPHITLHLSGTPYRILMTTEFEKDDIIGFYQASDILDAKKEWDEKHFGDIENQIINPDTDKPYQEWDNPYFGFPQMVRFAFTPSKRIRGRLEELQKQGIKSKFDEIFKPKSIKKQDDNSHKEFVYSGDILEFLRVIDGSQEDESLLGFLNYDKIINGSLCHHMVVVLPYRASCDALEKLIKDNSKVFCNLDKYEIINISGVDEPNKYSIKDVKRLISKAESEGRKTITLTVNRMLTGSTVPDWDTMLYLKDTRSPQEYDQTIFRLQNQYVVKYESKKDDEIIKYDKKPQTLLIDFSPNRIFLMQEERSLVYNANVEKKGKNALIDQISKDISYSPIIMLDKRRMKQVNAIDLLSAIDNYSKDRGIYDEAQDIPIDLGLLNDDDIRKEIERQGEFKGRQGFETNVGEDDDEDIDEASIQPITTSDISNDDGSADSTVNTDDDSQKVIERQFKTYYSRILFYSALTDDNVTTLREIIDSMSSCDNNIRIAKNLGLEKGILQKISEKMDYFAGIKLDNTISRINRLSNDVSLTPLERAQTAIQQFDRLSESEVITPQHTALKMMEELGDERLKTIVEKQGMIVDIASKKAEFALAIVSHLDNIGVDVTKYKNTIYSIPTSRIAYEFTRKIYSTLQLNTKNISDDITSYNLIDNGENSDWNEKIAKAYNLEGEKKMEFDAIVGNPPYNETIGSGSNSSLGKQLFPYFIINAIKSGTPYISLITPSRWFTGDAQDKSFVKLRDFLRKNNHISKIFNYPVANDVFDDVTIKGGVNFFLYEKNYTGDVQFNIVQKDNTIIQNRKLFEDGLDIVLGDGEEYKIIQKINKKNFIPLTTITKGRNAFGIIGKDSVVSTISTNNRTEINNCELRCKNGVIRWINADKVTKNQDLFKKYKVFISKSAGDPSKDLKVIGIPYIGGKDSACTDSLIPIGSFDNVIEANNLKKYLQTRFLRFMVSILKVSQNVTQVVYGFVPIQDFTKNSDIKWDKQLSNIDEQLFKKYKLTDEEIKYIKNRVPTVKGDE